ncbi:MAG: threonine synthase [Elusimicrobia bacterium RIFCSPLOWO2_12_FULL_59_9]|nr:MAG: threonine synthase [Elusimicrobia bacterium RIFCSPLOWO2_12_FULL_59_9]
MAKIEGFKCVSCSKEHGAKDVRYICPSCGGNVQVVYDYKAARGRLTRKFFAENPDQSPWRYLDLLPLKGDPSFWPVESGWTPLFHAQRLGRKLGLSRLHLKDDGRQPSASFKDRASAVVLARALETGERAIAAASTGNAAASMACLAAGSGLRTVIFVPQSAPPAKLTQLLVFGATVVTVMGNYDDAFDLCLQATEKFGWYNRNTGFNPFTREGKKTCAFEICEQLDWEAPDKVFVPVGDGNILSGLWKGFQEFERLKLIKKTPQLVAVQAEKSDAVKKAFETGNKLEPVSGQTLADSISVRLPRDGQAAVEALRQSQGFAVSVTDQEILEAVVSVAREANVFAEPAGAASVAGLKKAAQQGRVGAQESVVALLTGNGLKDAASVVQALKPPYLIRPSIEELEVLMDKHAGHFTAP